MTTQTPERVQTYAGPEAWRISKGKICRGRDTEGTYEEHPFQQILGQLRRVGIHAGMSDDGKPYEYVEADVEKDGHTVSVKVSTSSITSSCGMARGLLNAAAGEWIAIETRQSDKPNKHGVLVTYVNLFHVDPKTWKATPVKPPKDDRQQAELLAELRGHPAYADRPARASQGGEDEDGMSEFHAFDALVQSKGWAGVLSAPEGYLSIANKAAKADYKTLGDVPEAVWKQMAASAAKADKCPKAVSDAASAEPDPFADES